MIDFLNKSVSLQRQNEIPDNILVNIRGDYYIKRVGNSFTFMIKKGIESEYVESYAVLFYVYPRAVAISLFLGDQWVRYRYNTTDNKYHKEYVSKYFILSMANRLMIKKENDVLKLCVYDKTSVELVIRKILTSFTNFFIYEKEFKMIFINENTNRKLVYDLKTNEYDSKVIKSGDTVLKCKVNDLYFDNIGGIDIYTKSDVFIESISRYYKLEKYLYILKRGNRYYLTDIDKNKILFTGTTLHLINNNGWVLDKAKNEILTIQSEDVDIMTYSNYTGGNKNSLKNYKRSKFSGVKPKRKKRSKK